MSAPKSLFLDAMTAYLGPLLKKHEQGQVLVWEDLQAAHKASTAVLENRKTDPVNRLVSKKIAALHEGQVAAYREAGSLAIKKWANAFPLEPMKENDTETAFVNRCVSALAKASTTSMPKWKLDDATTIACSSIRQVAKACFEKYNPHPAVAKTGVDIEPTQSHSMDEVGDEDDEDAVHTGDEVDDEEEEEEDDDHDDGEGMEENDGEEDEADGAEAGTVRTAGKKTGAGASSGNGGNKKSQGKPSAPAKKRNNSNNDTGNGKATAKKKTSNAKSGIRNRGAKSGRGRRGGHGGRGGAASHSRNNSRDNN